MLDADMIDILLRVSENMIIPVLVSGLALSAVVLFIYANDPNVKLRRIIRRRGRMNEDKEREKLHVLIADGLTSLLEDAEYEGRVSRKTVEEAYLWLGNRLCIKDFLHGRHSRDNLKRVIKHRLNAGVHDKKVVFPDQKYV